MAMPALHQWHPPLVALFPPNPAKQVTAQSPQAAVPGSASQASDLAAQQAAAIGLAAAQSSASSAVGRCKADATDLPDHAAAAKAPAGGAALSSQQSQVAVNTNAALAGESDGEDNIAAGDTGKQVAGYRR